MPLTVAYMLSPSPYTNLFVKIALDIGPKVLSLEAKYVTFSRVGALEDIHKEVSPVKNGLTY